jgi:ribosomal protein L15
LPKVRGFQSFKQQAQVVNVADLVKVAAGSVVDARKLQTLGLIQDHRAAVKLIGSAKLPKLTVIAQGSTAGARAAVESAGGTLEIKALATKPKAATVTSK